MKKIVIINGTGGSGKDTFAEMCKEYATVMNVSAVDGVKKIAKFVGWNGDKDPTSRKFLSDLKDLLDGYNDFSSKYLENSIDDFFQNGAELMFIHMREPEQIKRFEEEFPHNVITLLVESNRVEPITSNHADRDVANYPYDQTLENNGSLEDLKEKAFTFVDFLRDLEYDQEK